MKLALRKLVIMVSIRGFAVAKMRDLYHSYHRGMGGNAENIGITAATVNTFGCANSQRDQ